MIHRAARCQTDPRDDVVVAARGDTSIAEFANAILAHPSRTLPGVMNEALLIRVSDLDNSLTF